MAATQIIKRLKNLFIYTTLRRKIILLTVLLVIVSQTILTATLAFTYYKIGIKRVFNDDIKIALDASAQLCDFYLTEHKRNMHSDIIAMRNIIWNNEEHLFNNPHDLQIVLDEEAKRRKLDEIILLSPDEIVGKNSLALSFIFSLNQVLDFSSLQRNEDILEIESLSDDGRIRMIMPYDLHRSLFIIVGKQFANHVTNNILNTQEKYLSLIHSLQSTQEQLQIAFSIIFIVLTTISIFLSVRLAKFISKPIHRLVSATEMIKQGDYTVAVPEQPGRDEMAILARAFNDMTKTLREQRDNLITANNEIDKRRQFIELILSEIGSGIITISPNGKIILLNNSAKQLLFKTKGQSIKYSFPELFKLLSKHPYPPQYSLEITRLGKRFSLELKINEVLKANGKTDYIIVTINDVSALVSAQRTAAWGDVARRVAHEIKNPLTPINLAIELIKKRYVHQVTEGQENFSRYLNTIGNHLDTITRIVEEFVNFARIPAPKITRIAINDLIRNHVITQQNIFQNIEYVIDIPEEILYCSCDPTQIGQVLTNLLKNAAESIEALQARKHDPQNHNLNSLHYSLINDNDKYKNPTIKVTLHDKDNSLYISIEDNGPGIPRDMIGRIFEPYVTSKTKGTGLGLAIVKKIIEDHGGHLLIENRNEGGVKASFSLNKAIEEICQDQ